MNTTINGDTKQAEAAIDAITAKVQQLRADVQSLNAELEALAQRHERHESVSTRAGGACAHMNGNKPELAGIAPAIAHILQRFDYRSIQGERRVVAKIFADLAFRVASLSTLAPSVANALTRLHDARTHMFEAMNAHESGTRAQDIEICEAMLSELDK